MTTQEIDAVFDRTFARLNEEQKANVRWHLEQGTGICYGREANHFFCQGRR